jgi:hypothetical protein
MYLTLILNLLILPIVFLVEKKNKNPPIRNLASELIIFYLVYKAHKNKLDDIYKFLSLLGGSLHFLRILLNYKKYLNIPKLYQILGIIGVILIFTKYYFIYPFINLFIIFKLTKSFGFNIFVDSIAIIALLFVVIFKKSTGDKIIDNFLLSDLIYHIFEILLTIIFNLNKKITV